MSLVEEIDALRKHLDGLADGSDDELIERYELKRPPIPPGLYWQLRWLAGWSLRWLKAARIWPADPWPVSLKQTQAHATAKPFLIWAVGTDCETLRAACTGFSRLQDSLSGFAPVLVTDVADFAFFSRLGWLVEYVPRVAGVGESYAQRKARFVARLYHNAPALPINAGLETGDQRDDIRQWLRHARLPKRGATNPIQR